MLSKARLVDICIRNWSYFCLPDFYGLAETHRWWVCNDARATFSECAWKGMTMGGYSSVIAVELWMLKTWQQRPKYALLQRRGVRPKSYSDQPWNTIVKTCAQKCALANICSGKYLLWLQQRAANAVCGKRAKVGGGTMGTFSSLSICQTVQIENHPEDNSTEAWEADANYRGPCRLVLRACAGLQGQEWGRIEGKMVLIRRSEPSLSSVRVT